MAVSVDPAWDCEATNGAIVNGGTSAMADFTAGWGSSESGSPQFVVNLAESRPGWYVGVRPRVVESKSDEQLSIIASLDHLQVQYEVFVQPQGTTATVGRYRYRSH